MKNNLYVFFLFFITGLMSCSHHSGLYEHAEKIMSQHPDSVLTLLSTIQDVNDLSEKDRAMYYLLLTEAENKTYVKHYFRFIDCNSYSNILIKPKIGEEKRRLGIIEGE